jgi:hypothetical protein
VLYYFAIKIIWSKINAESKLLDSVVRTVFKLQPISNLGFLPIWFILQLKEITLVNTTVMWRKLLIIHLLLVLTLLPVAQAMSMVAGSPEASQKTSRMSHALMNMDCGQMDPNQCVDFDTCASTGHTSCDSKTKSTLMLPALTINRDTHVYSAQSIRQYSSHHTELLLRPPRNV